MISLRHHIISIAAVFLALALGVVLGSTSLSEGLLSGLRSDNTSLTSTNSDLETRNNTLRSQLTSANGFESAIAPLALRDVLAKRTVLVVTGPDADAGARDAIVKLVAEAGATVTGQVSLTASFVNPSNADQLRSTVTNVIPAGVQLPTGTVDAGSLAGSLLGSVLLLNAKTAQPQSTPEELTVALKALQAGGFLGQSVAEVKPAQLAVVLTGGAVTGDGAGDRAASVARFAAALDRSGAGAVLAGTSGSADGNGSVGVARADNDISSALSTVDNVGTSAGQITTVLALKEQLDGKAGRYGTARSAQGITLNAQQGS
ncbi:MAG: copper transporter [Mycobacteriaceae bacterium]